MGKRQTIVALGITDNPCNKYYDNRKATKVKKSKSLGSGPSRFKTIEGYNKSDYMTGQTIPDRDKHLVLTRKVNPQISFPHETKRIFADIRHKTVVPSPDSYHTKEHLR